ncbi:MAG: SulP family inorganic anion transporter [Bacteroidetes bacterium]|nr:MAG: SulP family inorganic anion transporter [Bacteroidota bacterium]
MRIQPKTGLQGLIENWQSDLIAAISVALVALPLGLGIALASGVPPMAGILSAIVGGVVTTFVRGSHVAINGPTAGLIAVILAALAALDDGSGHALNYVLAACVVSGALQVVLGLCRLGRFADLFHSTVIQGILAAIGVIIFAKQMHFALDTAPDSHHIIETLVDIIREIPNANPFVAVISLTGLLLLLFHSRISYRLFHILPAPMWVLFISIPFVYAFNFFEPHTLTFLGRSYAVGPDLLIQIPDNILQAIIFPDFSKIGTLPFWTSVLSITMIASIESLASGKAVDKLDPYKRKTNLNKDLAAVGLSTMVAGAIGGLPIVNVIVRSTVNVHNNAKTRWSNFYHGVLLLVFVLLLAPVIQKVPLCALAILLVHTGYKLAAPRVFKRAFSQGVEQLIIFSGTLMITLYTNLLIGIFGGLLLTLGMHFLLAMVPVRTFFQMIFKGGSESLLQDDGSYVVQIRGIANFLSTIKIDKLLQTLPAGSKVRIDLSGVRLVDFSIMEHLYEFKRAHATTGGWVDITGLDRHSSSSTNRQALKINTPPLPRLTSRQLRLQALAETHGWNFKLGSSDQIEYLQTFYFFKPRPIEEKLNSIFNTNKDVSWEIMDIMFEEGAFISSEEYKTTLGLIRFPFQIPKFTIERMTFPERLLNLADHKDIDYVLYHDFSDEYLVKVEDRDAMRAFLQPELRKIIEESEVIHHLECNGDGILLFTDNLRLAPVRDYDKIVEFARTLKRLIEAQEERRS